MTGDITEYSCIRVHQYFDIAIRYADYCNLNINVEMPIASNEAATEVKASSC